VGVPPPLSKVGTRAGDEIQGWERPGRNILTNQPRQRTKPGSRELTLTSIVPLMPLFGDPAP
jgi:hypothetical protein